MSVRISQMHFQKIKITFNLSLFLSRSLSLSLSLSVSLSHTHTVLDLKYWIKKIALQNQNYKISFGHNVWNRQYELLKGNHGNISIDGIRTLLVFVSCFTVQLEIYLYYSSHVSLLVMSVQYPSARCLYHAGICRPSLLRGLNYLIFSLLWFRILIQRIV